MRLFVSTIAILCFILQPLTTWASLTDDLQSEINQKQAQIQELEKQIAQYRELLSSKKSESNTLKNQISKLETQIKKLEAEIRLTQTRISETNLKIQGLNSDIATKNLELEKQKNNLGQILRVIYEFDQESNFTLVFRNSSFSSFLSQVQYINNLRGGVQEKLKNIKDLKAQLEGQKSESENQKAALEDLKKQLSGKSLVLDDQKDEKQGLLTTTKNQEKIYQSTLTELERKQQQIEQEMYLIEEKLRLAIDPNSVPTAQKGIMAWPIKASLSQTYGCLHTAFARRSYPLCDNKKGGFHNGIDIDGDMGDPVRAALSGTVAYVGNLGRYSYGKWIGIKHDNGVTTIYAHLSAQSVSVGQKVKTGDIIGYVGSTGYSTGSHLHFGVYLTSSITLNESKIVRGLMIPTGYYLNPLSYL